MRLTENEVNKIIQRIFITWKSEKLITPISSEGEILLLLEEIFLTNLKQEDVLNAEVEKLLDQIMSTTNQEIDQRKMFQMLKKQLIKDRKLVI